VYELLLISPEIKRLIHGSASEEDIERAAFRDADMLFKNGLRHVVSGQTTAAELMHACRRDVWSHGSV
jgi:general secretion pathway protein E